MGHHGIDPRDRRLQRAGVPVGTARGLGRGCRDSLRCWSCVRTCASFRPWPSSASCSSWAGNHCLPYWSWSPYYKVTVVVPEDQPDATYIDANGVPHQSAVAVDVRRRENPEYFIPYERAESSTWTTCSSSAPDRAPTSRSPCPRARSHIDAVEIDPKLHADRSRSPSRPAVPGPSSQSVRQRRTRVPGADRRRVRPHPLRAARFPDAGERPVIPAARVVPLHGRRPWSPRETTSRRMACSPCTTSTARTGWWTASPERSTRCTAQPLCRQRRDRRAACRPHGRPAGRRCRAAPRVGVAGDRRRGGGLSGDRRLPVPLPPDEVDPELYLLTLVLILGASLLFVRVASGPFRPMRGYARPVLHGSRRSCCSRPRAWSSSRCCSGRPGSSTRSSSRGVLVSVLAAIEVARRWRPSNPARLYGALLVGDRDRLVGPGGVPAARWTWLHDSPLPSSSPSLRSSSPTWSSPIGSGTSRRRMSPSARTCSARWSVASSSTLRW